jgi:hypothetical protein
VLSAFEESSAACISDMLRQVSNGQYLDAIRMAEKFILHVEVLFATIDDLEFHFASLGMKGTLTPSMSNNIPLTPIAVAQACLTFEKRGCYAVRRSSFSPSCPIHRKLEPGGWA